MKSSASGVFMAACLLLGVFLWCAVIAADYTTAETLVRLGAIVWGTLMVLGVLAFWSDDE